MSNINFTNRIYVSITGSKDIHWISKLKEIEKYKIREIALFLECFKKPQREKIYNALLKSKIKKIPLVHLRNQMSKDEIKFLIENFNSQYFTIHENTFNIIDKWKGYYNKLYLEMNTDNIISKNVKVSKIGGFCIDLSHFKVEEEKWSKEFEYIIKRRKWKNLFGCNHLNGYSYKKNSDMHTVNSLNDFDYLKTLPPFIFGKIIALECNNSIADQLRFKEYIIKNY